MANEHKEFEFRFNMYYSHICFHIAVMLCAQCRVKIMGLRLGLVRIAATFVYINVNDAAQPTV
jgi:predicted metal-binding protein